MAWNRWLLTVILVVAPAGSLAANCIKNQDHRSNKNSGVMVSEFLISGTQTLSSDQLNRFRANLIGACFDDDEKELQEQVRALFQNAGYFEAFLKSLRVNPVDPLGVPKPVALEADVQEGRLFSRSAKSASPVTMLLVRPSCAARFRSRKATCSHAKRLPEAWMLCAFSTANLDLLIS